MKTDIVKIEIPQDEFRKTIYYTKYSNEGYPQSYKKEWDDINIAVIDKFFKKYLGIKVVKFLGIGVGSGGATYLTDENKVLKITERESEAEFSNTLIANKTKKHALIYSVTKLGDTGYCAILREYLEMLSPQEYKIWALAGEIYDILLHERITNDAYDALDIFLARNKSDKIETTITLTEKEKKNVVEFYYRIVDFEKHFNSLGLNANDVRGRNIGKRNGEYVCFDCKYSRGAKIQSEKKYYDVGGFVKCLHCGSSEKYMVSVAIFSGELSEPEIMYSSPSL